MKTGRLVFTRLSGDRDVYLWCDLTTWHLLELDEQRCEHGLGVTRCGACGSPIQIVGTVECEHLLGVLDELAPGQTALIIPGRSNGVRVERVVDGVEPWQLRAGASCVDGAEGVA